LTFGQEPQKPAKPAEPVKTEQSKKKGCSKAQMKECAKQKESQSTCPHAKSAQPAAKPEAKSEKPSK